MQSNCVRGCAYCSKVWAKLSDFSAGCRSCILGFRVCMAPIGSKLHETLLFTIGNDTHHLLSWKYQLPYEYIEAEPPLAPHHILWLTGKRERRNQFLDKFRDSVTTAPRIPSCTSIDIRASDLFRTTRSPSPRTGPATTCSMDGMCLWFYFS